MSNNQSLRDSVPMIMNLLGKYHYSKSYIAALRKHFPHVVDLYEENGIVNYKEGQYQHFLSHIEKEYENKKLRADLFRYYRKCAYYLDEYCRTGEILPTLLAKDKYNKLSPNFILILGLRIDIFAAISHLSLRQSSLQYIQYSGVAFPCTRRDLAANIVYTPTEH